MLNRISTMMLRLVLDEWPEETNSPFDLHMLLTIDDDGTDAWNSSIENDDNPSTNNVEYETRVNVNVADRP
jgi:hypothetical protein